MQSIYKNIDKKIFLWFCAAILIALTITSPAIALIAGTIIALIFGNPLRDLTSVAAKYMLQLSVVLLGFGLKIGLLVSVGYASINITLLSIVFTLLFGWWLGRIFSIEKNLSLLINGGTAICGGSAVAAISSAINASQAHTAVAMAVIFLLNAVALLTFPHIGHFFDLSQTDFGLWVAIAVHDISSVVGSSAIYGSQALAIATTVKLTRVLWIIPISILSSQLNPKGSKVKLPLFLLGFIAAAIIRSYVPQAESLWSMIASGGKNLMVATLFLIGAGLTRKELSHIGFKPLLVAVILWVAVSSLSLAAIVNGWFTVTLPTGGCS